MFMQTRICVKKSAVIVHSTSTDSDGSMPRLCILRIGGSPWRMFISIGKAIETCAPTSLTFCHAGHVDEQVIRSDADVTVPADTRGQLVENRPDAERREDVCCNLEVELPADRPGQVGRRITKIDLAAHDHRHELIARGEPLLLD